MLPSPPPPLSPLLLRLRCRSDLPLLVLIAGDPLRCRFPIRRSAAAEAEIFGNGAACS